MTEDGWTTDDDTTGFEPVTFSKSHFNGRLFCTLCHYTTAHTTAHLAELHHSLGIYKGRGTERERGILSFFGVGLWGKKVKKGGFGFLG